MRDKSKEKGAVSAEFVIVMLFILLPLLAGVIDLGRVIVAGHVINRAAREGAALARWEPTAGFPASEAAALNYILNSGLEAERAGVDVSGAMVRGSEVAVLVTFNLVDYALLPWGDFLPDSISAMARARRE